jgi:branched-chain amino acid aminotransferase
VKLFYYLNGKFIEKEKAVIPVNDLSILRAYGVFDYLRTYKRIPFHLEEHLDRFFHSAASLNLKPSLSKKEMEKIIFELIKKNKQLKDLSFRIVLTGGASEDARISDKPNFFIIVNPAHAYPKKVFTQGIKLLTLDYCREFPATKSINYLWAISQWKNILKKGATEILYVWQGKIFEASTSNFFMVKNKVLYTPKNEVLEGVTRKIVIKLAKENKFRVVEKDILLKDALKADECFITATDKEIMPVVKINNQTIGRGRPGEQTKKLLSLYKELIN